LTKEAIVDKARKPGKLFGLKEWLTLEDAAKHLTLILDEEVTVPDVLRLALDSRLTLSVWFVNPTRAKEGRLVPLSECGVQLLPGLRTKDLKIQAPQVFTKEEFRAFYPTIKEHVEAGDITVRPNAVPYSDEDDQWLVQDDEVTWIGGIWDLPMIAGDALEVERRFQMETGGPALTSIALIGAFVVRDGVVCQLQEPPERTRVQSDSTPSLERPTCYYPANELPQDAVLVVRTAALRDFERRLADEAPQNEKNLSRREETTLLNITGALLGLLLGKTQSGKPMSVFKDQTAVIEALLTDYSDKPGIAKRTLEAKLAAAKRSLSSS
jgi:hypothetical protein